MFEKKYFAQLYGKDSCIDGDFNAKEHCQYIKSLFSLMDLEVHKLVDFGFGKANFLKKALEVFSPKYVEACDISKTATSWLQQKKWARNLQIKNIALQDFRSRHIFDLGICNSVLQYVEDEVLEESLKVMSQTTRYLYLHVPTAEDYIILKENLKFEDPYAKARPKDLYWDLIYKYFTIVSYGLLESKARPNLESPFIDSLYRL